LSRNRRLQFLFGRWDFADQFAENDIAHCKTDGRQRDGAAAELMNQVVVAAAASQGAQFAAAIEGLKNDARVIGEAAHYPEIDLHKLRQAANFQSSQDFI
jgi:hypothetical protein